MRAIEKDNQGSGKPENSTTQSKVTQTFKGNSNVDVYPNYHNLSASQAELNLLLLIMGTKSGSFCGRCHEPKTSHYLECFIRAMLGD